MRRWCMNMLCNFFFYFPFALRAVELVFGVAASTLDVERAGVGLPRLVNRNSNAMPSVNYVTIVQFFW
jgi:hypothetical protein